MGFSPGRGATARTDQRLPPRPHIKIRLIDAGVVIALQGYVCFEVGRQVLEATNPLVALEAWRLTERYDGSRELYDHHADDAEYYNVAQDPQNQPEVQKLGAMLASYFGPLVTRPLKPMKGKE